MIQTHTTGPRLRARRRSRPAEPLPLWTKTCADAGATSQSTRTREGGAVAPLCGPRRQLPRARCDAPRDGGFPGPTTTKRGTSTLRNPPGTPETDNRGDQDDRRTPRPASTTPTSLEPQTASHSLANPSATDAEGKGIVFLSLSTVQTNTTKTYHCAGRPSGSAKTTAHARRQCAATLAELYP